MHERQWFKASAVGATVLFAFLMLPACEVVTIQGMLSPSGDAAAGKTVYEANACNACHGADGSGPPSIIGEGAASITEQAVFGIDHPGGAFPDLTAEDVANIAAYVRGPGVDGDDDEDD